MNKLTCTPGTSRPPCHNSSLGRIQDQNIEYADSHDRGQVDQYV